MLKVVDYDIVFAEVPDEVTLAFNLSRCPNHCYGCHSPQLWKDIGEPLTKERLANLVGRYRTAITCICFMGGDNDPESLIELTQYSHQAFPELKCAWYSGKRQLPEIMSPFIWDYIKLGPFIPSRGALNKSTTNQHFYKVLPSRKLVDITHHFYTKLGSNN